MDMEKMPLVQLLQYYSSITPDEYIRLSSLMVKYEYLLTDYEIYDYRSLLYSIDRIDDIRISMTMMMSISRYIQPSPTSELVLAVWAWTIMRRIDILGDWYIYYCKAANMLGIHALSIKRRQIATVWWGRSPTTTVSDIIPICNIYQLHDILHNIKTYPFHLIRVSDPLDQTPYIRAIRTASISIPHSNLLSIGIEMLKEGSDIIDLSKNVRHSQLTDILSIVLLYKDTMALSYLLSSIPSDECVEKIRPMRGIYYPTDISIYTHT